MSNNKLFNELMEGNLTLKHPTMAPEDFDTLLASTMSHSVISDGMPKHAVELEDLIGEKEDYIESLCDLVDEAREVRDLLYDAWQKYDWASFEVARNNNIYEPDIDAEQNYYDMDSYVDELDSEIDTCREELEELQKELAELNKAIGEDGNKLSWTTSIVVVLHPDDVKRFVDADEVVYRIGALYYWLVKETPESETPTEDTPTYGVCSEDCGGGCIAYFKSREEAEDYIREQVRPSEFWIMDNEHEFAKE